MKVFKFRIAVVALALLVGCSSQPAQGDSVPALLTGFDSQAHAELESVVSEALGGQSVTLAEQALTQQSLLIIERQPTRTLQQPRVPGRELQMPERFRLMTDGTGCWLLQLSSGARWPLQNASCRPETES